MAACQPYAAAPPPPREGDVAATISVPHRRVGLIIGRGGENVRFLQQQTRAHVQVQPERDAPGAERPHLRGGRDACAEAARISRTPDGRAPARGLAAAAAPGMMSHTARRSEADTRRRAEEPDGTEFLEEARTPGGFAGGDSPGGFAARDASADWHPRIGIRGLHPARARARASPPPPPPSPPSNANDRIDTTRCTRRGGVSGGAYVPSPAAVAPAYAAVAAAAANPWAAHADLTRVPRARTSPPRSTGIATLNISTARTWRTRNSPPTDTPTTGWPTGRIPTTEERIPTTEERIPTTEERTRTTGRLRERTRASILGAHRRGATRDGGDTRDGDSGTRDAEGSPARPGRHEESGPAGTGPGSARALARVREPRTPSRAANAAAA